MFGVYGAGGRRGALAAGCAVAALMGLTGCGGGDDGDGRSGAGKGPAPSRPATAGGLSEARLTAVAFRDGERAGDLTASEYTLDGPLGDAYTADPAVCRPLVSLAGDVSGHEPVAQVQRKADKPEDMLGVTVDITLRSYAGDEADEAKAYRFTVLDVKGKLKLYEYLTVLRSGSTTLAFRGEILGTQDIGGVPEDVMAAQWKKFRAGQA
ncbi:hypothetical protein ACFWBV_21130 [Streptomyces sp. NPDC060030]|uniref:hypothetical protein n=1 Tax=Streptomyces sp. NPDC060030 TaxID=3347042 RepID=UPI00368D67DE